MHKSISTSVLLIALAGSAHAIKINSVGNCDITESTTWDGSPA